MSVNPFYFHIKDVTHRFYLYPCLTHIIGLVMSKKSFTLLIVGTICLISFAVWTILVAFADVRPFGVNDTKIGLSTLNLWIFHHVGTNMGLFVVTDWLGLVPIAICLIFGVVGFIELIRRKSLFKVDRDIILLGIYYAVVIFLYLLFEMVVINYRPILIDGHMESSYPSSTTLLVLSVMPTLSFEADKRFKNKWIKRIINLSAVSFSLFMAIGRLVSGVHWISDIIGSIILSGGLFTMYLFSLSCIEDKERNNNGVQRQVIRIKKK